LFSKAKIHVEDLVRNKSIINEARAMSFALSRIIYPENPSSAVVRFLNYVDTLFWEKKGNRAPPPHAYKQTTVKQYAKLFSTKTFVETGTYRGDMVEATKKTLTKSIQSSLMLIFTQLPNKGSQDMETSRSSKVTAAKNYPSS